MLIPNLLTFHRTKPLLFVLIVGLTIMRILLRSLDDIFILSFSLDHAEKFKKYLSFKHPNRSISLERENDGRLSCLGINIFH